MKIKTISITALSALAGTGLALAQGYNPLSSLLGTAQGAVAQLVTLLMGVAMVCFFYGLVVFIWKGREGGEAVAKAKQFMIYSVVSLFVMVSIWGIISFMQGTLNIDPYARVKVPPVPGMNQPN